LARYCGKSLEDSHIAVINIGGRYFDYFLSLFDSTIPNAIPKRVACITDRDPERKEKTSAQSKKCYPFEYNQDATQYDYKDNSTEKIDCYRVHANIRVFSQEAEKGKTFEYDLALHNSTSEILITESMINQSELEDLMLCQRNDEQLSVLVSKLRRGEENARIIDAITANTSWSDNDKKKAIIAARYLNSVGKGENALELAYSLEENLKTSATTFTVPPYIEEAIKWICQ
jgi:predicted ATP-dependent endonuclease of OLD family